MSNANAFDYKLSVKNLTKAEISIAKELLENSKEKLPSTMIERVRKNINVRFKKLNKDDSPMPICLSEVFKEKNKKTENIVWGSYNRVRRTIVIAKSLLTYYGLGESSSELNCRHKNMRDSPLQLFFMKWHMFMISINGKTQVRN